MIIFCCSAEQVTLISQTEAPDSNATEAHAKEVRFVHVHIIYFSTRVANISYFMFNIIFLSHAFICII